MGSVQRPCQVAGITLVFGSPIDQKALVGTKCDIDVEERQVAMDEAQAFAEARGWLYFETSAKFGVHVRDAFYLLACTVMNRLNEADPKNLINGGGKGVDVRGGGTAKEGSKGGCC